MMSEVGRSDVSSKSSLSLIWSLMLLTSVSPICFMSVITVMVLLEMAWVVFTTREMMVEKVNGIWVWADERLVFESTLVCVKNVGELRVSRNMQNTLFITEQTCHKNSRLCGRTTRFISSKCWENEVGGESLRTERVSKWSYAKVSSGEERERARVNRKRIPVIQVRADDGRENGRKKKGESLFGTHSSTGK